MRLWHYELIPYLDRQHLLSQWRELIAIKRKIDRYNTPNHSLVNRIIDYSIDEYKYYSGLVITEMTQRGYSVNPKLVNEIYDFNNDAFPTKKFEKIFKDWHNDTYLLICYYNLLEKYLSKPTSEQKEMIDNIKCYLSSQKHLGVL